MSTKNGIREEDASNGDNKGSVEPVDTKSVLDHDDPFAVREGKTLTWQNVNMTIATKGEAQSKNILDSVWGEVPPKETTAIMGSSGAGKSSLLNVLAGRAKTSGKLTVEADVRLDGFHVDPTNVKVRQQIAFVAQDDSLQLTSTPREAIRFSAKLRLPRTTSELDLDRLTNHMLEELGLNHCADTLIGGGLNKGISGGERKRTSVGVELVVKPSLVFLDEPTSGLDSFSALQLCQVLKKVANAGSSVLFTIHQPASEIFNSFDHLILLAKGRVMYQGAVSAVPDFFATCGHAVPPNYNPADWIMSVAQTRGLEELEGDGFFVKDPKPINGGNESDISKRCKKTLGSIMGVKDSTFHNDDSNHVGFLVQLTLLFQREIQNFRRDKKALASRVVVTLFMSLLVGIIFFEVGETDLAKKSNLQSVFGALIMACLLSMFGSAQPALHQFPAERPVFLREYSTNHYSVSSYFASRLTMELLVTAGQKVIMTVVTYFMVGFQMSFGTYFAINYVLSLASTALAVALGCVVEDTKVANEMLPILFVPQMLFSGFFVSPELIPSWLQWVQYLCTLTYAIRILLVAEFDRDCGSPEGNENCAELLDLVEANPDDMWWYWLVICIIFVFFRVLALVLLKTKASKFY